MDTSGPGPAATAGPVGRPTSAAPSPVATPVAGAVADAFGLGAVRGDWRPVPGGASHLLWQLRTSSGVWAVKQLNRSREPWWLADHLIATAIEQAAYRSGISMPRPVPPLRPAGGLLADLPVAGAPVSFLVHEWCPGEVLDNAHPPPALAEWVGRTLAALHALPVDVDATTATPRVTHPVEEWTAWLDGAATGPDAGFVRTVLGFRADIARAIELVGPVDPAGSGWTPVLTHRDVKPDNVLRTPAGAILLDWDGAGPDVAEWEATRAALAFSRAGAGWDRVGFGRVLRAYRAAGGRRIPSEPGSFTGVLQGQLGGAAWMLWRALGHRPVSPPERAAAHHHTLAILADLRLALRHLATWTDWLRDLPD